MSSAERRAEAWGAGVGGHHQAGVGIVDDPCLARRPGADRLDRMVLSPAAARLAGKAPAGDERFDGGTGPCPYQQYFGRSASTSGIGPSTDRTGMSPAA